MCNHKHGKAGIDAIWLAQLAVNAVGDLVFWRELTDKEREFGDIPRVYKDVQAQELAIAVAINKPVGEMVRALVVDMSKAIKAKDTLAVNAVTVDTSAVRVAIKQAIANAIMVGKQQVFDEYRRQTGHRMALPPKVRGKLTAKLVAGKASAEADRIGNEARAMAQKMAYDQIGRDVYDPDKLEEFVRATAEQIVKQTAMSDAREANGVGRILAAEDTAGDIESVVYTAVMDNGVCDVCEGQDGDEYGPDEMGQAPNPDCEGALWAGCRCAEIIIYRKG
jgi:hypothetical protein